MSYRKPFEKIVTLSKTNHRYYGPTESKKFKQSLTSIATDLKTVFYEIDSISKDIETLASGYLLPSGSVNSLYDLKREMFSLESKFNQRMYIQADPSPVYL